MNKYTGLSDFEINCQVLEILQPDIKHMCLSDDERSFYHCGVDGNGFYETVIPDYCNNPSDAMPIIIDNKIDLTHLVGSAVCAKHKEYWRISKNPYRAGCEVFLMMKDAENEN